MNTAELRGKRADTIKEARRVYETAESEKRDPSAEEREQFDRLMQSADAQMRDIERLEKLERDEAGLAAIPETRAARREPEVASAAGTVATRKATSVPEYREELIRYMRTGEQSRELRALSTTTTAGGYTVPEEWERSVLGVMRDTIPMRGVSRVIQIDNDRNFPLVTTHAVAAWQTENSAYTGGSDPVFGTIQLEALKAGTIILIPEELLFDSAIDIEAFVRDEIAASIGVLENTAYTVGGGTTDPQGVVGRASAGVTAASATAIAADEIITLFHSLKQGYRSNGTFMMEDATLLHIRLKKDATGQYLWAPGLTAGTPDTLLGRPVVTNEDMATIATGATTVLFGDFSKFVIADRTGLSIQRLDERYADYGQVGFRVWHRTDSNLLLTEAVKKLVQA